MKQFICILKREIFVKIKSKSFYLFVFVSPILFLIPIVFSIFNKSKIVKFTEKNYVGIYSNNVIIFDDTVEYRGIKFFDLDKNEIKEFNLKKFDFEKYLGILDLSSYGLENTNTKTSIKLYMSENDLTYSDKYVKDVESFINQEIINNYAKKIHLPDSISYNLSNLSSIHPIVYENSELIKSKTTASSLAYILGMLLYIMFILYNNNILKSVLEEKNNKLAEVLSIFVKPINLMLGKIIGLGLASLIQLFMWIIVFYFYLKFILWYDINFIGNSESSTNFFSVSLSSISKLPILNICLYLPLFFIFGFLMNGAISTIIAIYSNGKNSNYLMFFGNILTLIAIYFGMYVATSPNSQISEFLAFFPLFSYLTVPVLLPYGIPTSQIVISLFILIFTVICLLFFSSYLYKKSIRE